MPFLFESSVSNIFGGFYQTTVVISKYCVTKSTPLRQMSFVSIMTLFGEYMGSVSSLTNFTAPNYFLLSQAHT